ncbi:hypothetical protein BO99DRAFT_257308 [Aspergillus violaceofuscus CBS 115571]|uniref:Secreted protein n=1 Tax=Aspergillus violaceofuscus (strain CBS 115571) TaxID=1450538 RepID=A0A2V5I289_ASPV1|nr:hypothetical protein BO99DRAFT_257308 [Aspergillus violaceofuscus CBS 115571]
MIVLMMVLVLVLVLVVVLEDVAKLACRCSLHRTVAATSWRCHRPGGSRAPVSGRSETRRVDRQHGQSQSPINAKLPLRGCLLNSCSCYTSCLASSAYRVPTLLAIRL